MTDEYTFLSWKAWPHRIIDWLKGVPTSKFQTITGRLNQDGVVYPCNEPVLVKKQRFNVQVDTSGPETIIPSISAWLGVTAGALKDYRLDIYVTIASIASATDNISIMFGTDDWIMDIDECCTMGDGRGAIYPIHAFPGEMNDVLAMTNKSWTTGNEYFDVTVLAYKMPSSICVA